MTELIITSPDQLREIIRDEIQRTTHQHPESEKDKLMILEEFRKYLPENPARQTIYGCLPCFSFGTLRKAW